MPRLAALGKTSSHAGRDLPTGFAYELLLVEASGMLQQASVTAIPADPGQLPQPRNPKQVAVPPSGWLTLRSYGPRAGPN